MKYVTTIGVAVLLLVLFIVCPLLTIGAINTLFGMNIAYTVWTWLSVAWLNLTTFGGLSMTIRSLKQN